MAPVMLLHGQRLTYNPTPTFLGLKFDRTLSFTAHIKATCDQMEAKIGALRSITGRDWGCRASDLRIVYCAAIQSVAHNTRLANK